MLHGLQNKKASLDQWYAGYEEEFEAREEVEETFRSITGELAKFCPKCVERDGATSLTRTRSSLSSLSIATNSLWPRVTRRGT